MKPRTLSYDSIMLLRASAPVTVLGVMLAFAMLGKVGRALAAESSVDYQPSSAVIANPDRGFYVQFTSQSERDPLSLQSLIKLRQRKITLVLRFYYLKKFRESSLSKTQLDLLTNDFSKLRRAGCKCVLRFAYSSRIGEPDASMRTVMHHIDQLQPILRDNADVISVLQVGFIGAWGELHSSSNGLDNPKSIKQVTGRLLRAIPSNRCVQVRTPAQKRYVVGSQQALKPFTNTAQARIGYHNDCFLADETDMGTYEKSRINEEKDLLAWETQFVPVGGETCKVSEFTLTKSARTEFSRFHWTYLNIDYHPNVISDWQEEGFLDELRKHLGYRLSLVNSRCSLDTGVKQGLSLSITLRNLGWAAPINPRDIYLVAVSQRKGKEFRAKLDVNPRTWLPEQPITINATIGITSKMPRDKYRLFLLLSDPEARLQNRPEYAIRLANQNIWDPESGRHDLKQSFDVTLEHSAERPDGDAWFEPIRIGQGTEEGL